MPKNLISSTLPLAIAIILFIVVGNFGIGRVLELRAQISKANIDKNVLTQKLNTLQTLNTNISTVSEASSIALPDQNPTLVVLTQIKNLASQSLISISNIKTGSSVSQSTNLPSANLSFDAVGPVPAIMSFLDGIHKISPISTIGSVKMSQGAQFATASVTVMSFWSPLPMQIPAVDQPITSLTADEQAILTSISTLIPPQFSHLSPTQGGRANPFGQ